MFFRPPDLREGDRRQLEDSRTMSYIWAKYPRVKFPSTRAMSKLGWYWRMISRRSYGSLARRPNSSTVRLFGNRQNYDWGITDNTKTKIWNQILGYFLTKMTKYDEEPHPEYSVLFDVNNNLYSIRLFALFIYFVTGSYLPNFANWIGLMSQ